MEDLKARYYRVARQLAVGREGGPESVANLPLVRQPYNPQHERERKRGLELLMQRSREQDAAENEILAQAAQVRVWGGCGGRRGCGCVCVCVCVCACV